MKTTLHTLDSVGVLPLPPPLLMACLPDTLTSRVEEGRSARMVPDNQKDTPKVSDNDLLTRVASNQDRDAFTQLFESIAPRVKAFMMRSGASPDAAEEIAQETFITVWRKAAQFDRAKSTAVTWIFTIARNLRIDRLRRERRPALDPNEPMLVPEASRSPLAEMEEAAVVERVKAALKDLPEDQREAVKLSFIEGLSHSQIAERLGVPLGTIKSRMRLSFEKLRLSLGDIR